MTTPQDQYADTFRQTQDTMLAAFDAWTRAWQQGMSQMTGSSPLDPQKVIDQVFDFAGMMLNAQRDFAKQLVAGTTSAADSLKSGSNAAADTLKNSAR